MKKVLLASALLVSVLVLAVLLYGVIGTPLRGKVIDKVTKKPVSGVEVRVNIKGKGTKTAPSGVFCIRGVWGKLQITAEATGYEEYQRDVKVSFLWGKDLGQISLKAVPTKEGAKKLVRQYRELADEERYIEMYKLLTPQDRKLVSRETFVGKQREKARDEEQWPWRVEAVYLEGSKAKVSVVYDKPSGSDIEIVEVWFIEGQWFRRLDVDSLILYEVSLDKIPQLEKAELGDEVSANSFDVVVHEVETSAVVTEEVTGGQVETYTARGKYVTVTMTATNTDERESVFSPDEYLVLIDSKSKTFSISGDVIPVMSELVSGEVTPGESRKGKLVFDVPEESSGFRLIIGSGDKRYVISLGV